MVTVEVRVQLDDMVRLDSMAADGEDDELQQLEEEEKQHGPQSRRRADAGATLSSAASPQA